MLAALSIAIAFQAAAPSPADQVVLRVQARYRNVSSLRATFEQRVSNATFGTVSKSRGTVYVKPPGKMRWDYAARRNRQTVSKTFFSDGTTLWAVDHQSLQYHQRPAGSTALPAALTFLTGTGNLLRDFIATLDPNSKRVAAPTGARIVKLTPRKPNAQYRALWLVVDSKTSAVIESVVLNSNGDVNAFRFGRADTRTPLANRLFVFNPRANQRYRRVKPPKAGP